MFLSKGVPHGYARLDVVGVDESGVVEPGDDDNRNRQLYVFKSAPQIYYMYSKLFKGEVIWS